MDNKQTLIKEEIDLLSKTGDITDIKRRFDKYVEQQNNKITEMERIIDGLTNTISDKNEEIEWLLQENKDMKNAVVANYDELKRQLEIAGFWNVDIENWFDRYIMFNNRG